jgi:hypothetical protein
MADCLWEEGVAEIVEQSEFHGPGNTAHEEMSTGSPSCLDLAGAWLKFCHEHCGPCLPKMDKAPMLPTRVICVDSNERKTPFLYESGGGPGHYFCLSYCWGDSRKALTTTKTYWPYRKEISIETLPRTFQDAIKVTRGLGVRYLWIDALCIIQDSKDDMAKEISTMGSIYRNATMTIAAANGNNADSGLFSIRDPRSVRPCLLFRIDNSDHWGRHHYPIVVENQNIRSFSSPLDNRAWILQEEMLSARTLVFSPGCLRWSCVMWGASESEPNGFENMASGFQFQSRIHNSS